MYKTLLLIGLTMNIATAEKLITHADKDCDFDISIYHKALKEKENRCLPLEEEEILLRQLSEFELGRFLLKNKGLSGYWTAFVILHGPKKKNLHPLEKWLVTKAPVVRATQERFKTFKRVLQKQIKDNVKLVSIPCGLMDDLLSLKHKGFKNVEIIGIDLDEQSLELAKENAKKHNIQNVDFIKKDAWNLDTEEKYDVITSNGLNIYERDDERVTALYQEFHKALKPGGILVTSFLTPPPALSKESTWTNYDPQAVLKQKAILGDIIQTNWQSFRTEALTREQLKQAGFTVLEVIYDSQGMFPTVIAQKCK